MVLYTCQRCLKEFDRKSNYTRHINKKHKCKEITSKQTNIKKKRVELPQYWCTCTKVGARR